MKRKYIVEKTRNGFLITFDHLSDSYRVENQFVAKELDEIVELIEQDLAEAMSKAGALGNNGEKIKDKDL